MSEIAGTNTPKKQTENVDGIENAQIQPNQPHMVVNQHQQPKGRPEIENLQDNKPEQNAEVGDKKNGDIQQKNIANLEIKIIPTIDKPQNQGIDQEKKPQLLDQDKNNEKILQSNVDGVQKFDNLKPSESLQEQNDSNRVANQDQGEDASKQNYDNGKSMVSGRKGSSDSIRESQLQNDTSQPQIAGGKKCFNKLCPSKKIFRKIRSRVQAQRYRFLCKSCYDNYVNNSFCQFCEQIYSNYENEDEDMNKWVGCDKCQRWNHIQCERKQRHKNFQISNNTHYQCLCCSKKSRTQNISQPSQNMESQTKRTTNAPPGMTGNKQERGEHQLTRNYRPKLEISREDKIPIFHKKVQSFPCLEPFLQTYNFRLWINENLIRQDIENLRTINRRPPPQDDHKKIKKVKQE